MSRRLIGALVVTFAVALTGASGAGAATTRVVMSGLAIRAGSPSDRRVRCMLPRQGAAARDLARAG
jgi:hypothetical protein